MLKRKSLFNNTLSLWLLQVFSYGVPLISIPVITKLVGYDDFSIFVVVYAFIQFSKVFSDYGLNIYGVELLAKTKNDFNLLSSIQTLFSAKILVITPISLVFVMIWAWLYGSLNIIDVIIILFTVLANSFYPNWIATGLERSEIHLLSQALSKSIYILILLSLESVTLTGLFFCLLITSFIATTISLWRFRIFFNGFSPQIKGILEPLRQSWGYFLSTSFSASYNLLPTSILGMLGSYNTGFYSIADTAYKAGQSAGIPVSQALLPFLARTKKISYFKNFVLFFLVLGIGILLLVYPYLEFLLLKFVGLSYVPAMEFITIFFVIIPINFLNVMCGYPLYSIIDKTFIAARTAIAGAFLFWFLVCLLLFSDAVTARAICYIILIVESCMLIMRLFIFKEVSAR
jgi:O-antigen/teichoic acid export membrane protein